MRGIIVVVIRDEQTVKLQVVATLTLKKAVDEAREALIII